jgi:chromosome segregation protein
VILKRIEMIGFKSFADRSVIELDFGVTTIVGPNGCGKSNVADALRWVFGEQNPRLLRGAQMEDVIFNGTDNRKAVSRAEVSVTFVGAEGTLPLDYHEITVTRRLFRSGESQYLINQTPCLLRDVRELFMGTGIGTHAYFLLEQGKIDMVLSAKPEDRRAIFEEAAGIMKYKMKKKASIQRLELTETNLIRLADIIREVKRQIISLERQAGKARRYQEARDELKNLELKVARGEFEERSKELKDLKDKIIEFSSQRDAIQEKVATLQRKIQQIKESHESVFNELGQLEKTDLELYHKSQAAAGEIKLLKERIDEFEARMISDQEEIKRSQERLNELKSQHELEKQNKEKFELAHGDKKADLEKRRSNLEIVLGSYEKNQEALNFAKGRFIDLKQEEAQLKNQMMVFHHNQKSIVLRKEKLLTEREKVNAHLKEKQGEKEQNENLKIHLQQELADFQSANQTLQGQKQKLEGERSSFFNEIEKEKEKFLKNTARREAVKEFAVLQFHQELHHSADKLFESVLDIPSVYRKAIRTVLGKKVSCVLKENRASIQKTASASFYPLDQQIQSFERVDFSRFPGFVGYAQDLVSYAKEYEGAVKSLLGSLVILKDFESLRSVESAWLGRFRFVTLEGDSVDYDGTWICSSQSEELEVDLSQVDNEIQASSQKMKVLESQRQPLDSQCEALEQELTNQREKIRLKELELANVSGHVERLCAKVKDLTEEDWSLSKEEDDLNRELDETEKIIDTLTKKLDEILSQFKEVTIEVEGKEKLIVELGDQKEAALIQLAELKVMSRSIEEDERRFASRINEIELSIQELERLIVRRNEDILAWTQKKKESEERALLLEREIWSWKNESENLKKNKEEVSQRVHSITETIRLDQETLNQESVELDRLRQELSTLEVSKAQVTLQRDNNKQRIREKYDLDILTVPLDLEINLQEIQPRITELQEKLRQMGDINLVAIQEFDEYRNRYEFLLKQQEDLIRAKDDLVKAIQKINITIKELFLDTFEKIQGTFNDLFRKLFGGGRAVLELLDEGDVLECGINIAAQPPGKKLQTISLLSGGEKTLTAIALLFAIFKVRPSPFCFMDEMDAALDESNILRFLSMLDEFKIQTQFILISHNKRTVSVADAVYGVTMEESGVSKIISIRLARSEDRDKVLAAS